jgi:hypothetical protein
MIIVFITKKRYLAIHIRPLLIYFGCIFSIKRNFKEIYLAIYKTIIDSFCMYFFYKKKRLPHVRQLRLFHTKKKECIII